MKEFLAKYVDWNVQLYYEKDFETSDLQQNSSISFSSFYCNVHDLDFHELINILQTYYIIFVILGLISFLGNGVAITHHAKKFYKQKNTKTKERKVYDMLIFNLCFAELLNAVYLTVYPIAVAKLANISKSLCDGLGVISALSIQSSVSFLVIITGYRLYGVLYPYKSIRMKTVVALSVLAWFVWLVVVSLPLFNVSLFAHAFTFGIEIVENHCEIPLFRIAFFVNLLANSSDNTQQPFGLVLDTLKNYISSNEVAVQVLNSFNLVDQDKFRFFEYFHPNRGCTIETFISNKFPRELFSFSLLTFDFVAFFFMIIANIIIFKKLSSCSFKNLLPTAMQKSNSKHKAEKTQNVKAENKQIYMRILVIVITDLICGIPVCLIGIVYYIGKAMNNCFGIDHVHFVQFIGPLLTVIVFPLNSVINPYVYSFQLWKSIYCFCKHQVQKFILSPLLSSSSCR